MPIAYVHYDLQDGYIHNWLAGGPQVVAVNHTDKEKIFREFYKPDSGISKKPVEQGTLGDAAFKVGSFQGQWVYTRCQEDHFIQHSRSFTSPHYLRSWAYAQLMSKEIQDVVLVMTTYGPADLWVNDKHMLRQEGYQEDTLQERKSWCALRGLLSPNVIMSWRCASASLGAVRPPRLACRLRKYAPACPPPSGG